VPGTARAPTPTLVVVTDDTGSDANGADEVVDEMVDELVGDDPDSTAEGIPRPSLDGVPDETPIDPGFDEAWRVDDDEAAGSNDEPYDLPEIVPATVEPDPEPEPAPRMPERSPPPPPPPADGEPAWRAYVPAVTTATVSPPVVDLRSPGRRPRVRRVTRVVRHVDPWSVFKIGLIFSLVAYVSLLTSGVLLWRVADATGTIDNVERWFLQFGWETFEFKGGEIFHNAWIIGLFGVVAMTGGLVLLATLFNLISDIVGGIRVTVLEEEVVERTLSSSRRYVVRRPPTMSAGNGATVASDWSVDDEPSERPVPTTAVRAPGREPVAVPADWSVDD
jgi:hypothetical protein